MERDGEREEKAGKKDQKKKKEMKQRFCSGTIQIAPWLWPRAKIHTGLAM